MENHEFKYKLGLEAVDKITGFKGIIGWRVEYITGCDQYGLTPKVNDKGETQKSEQVDENRIEIIGKGINLYEQEELIQAPAVKEKPGGPQPFVGK